MASNQEEEEEWARPSGRNSTIWNHFKESKKDREQKKETIRVKCNYCPSTFVHSSSTHNYWRHMRKDHPTIKIDEKASGSKDESSSDPDPYQGATGKARQQLITNSLFNARNEPLKKVCINITKQIQVFTLLNSFFYVNNLPTKMNDKAYTT